jgi:hypothetical protein
MEIVSSTQQFEEPQMLNPHATIHFLIVIVHLVVLVFNIYKMHGENNIK